MKSYLDLIPISAKVHKRRNRMTLFCIILAVFLVTSVFSMADMGVRMEENRVIKKHGSWHIALQGLPLDTVKEILLRSDIKASSWFDVVNSNIVGEFGRLEGENICYVQFKNHIDIRKTIADIREQYRLTDNQISENTALLGIRGLSSNSFMMGLYRVAGILFVMVLAAGILMIAGNINSNVAERTQFFGMMRCIGASKAQIIRFVRLEALCWCKSAIPIGVILGVVSTWGICAFLRFVIKGELSMIPLFEVSGIGIASGAIVGILTVLLAAQSPAKHAADTSPMAAVSGNIFYNRIGKFASPIRRTLHQRQFLHAGLHIKNVRHTADMGCIKIETSLGIHHAVSAKKNLVLMTSSFALSILLFLSFSATLELFHHVLKPLQPYAPDLSIISNDRSCNIERNLTEEIRALPGVKRVFGRMFRGEIPIMSEKGVGSIDFISYEENQFQWAKADVLEGDLSKVIGDGSFVITVFDKRNPLTVGDKIKLDSGELTIACVLSDSPFDKTDTPTIICSEETFIRLTGEANYTVIDIQLTQSGPDSTVSAIRNRTGDLYSLSDRREINRDIVMTYVAFGLLAYGFIAIITLITILNIITGISMSVSARIRQYGAMRAVGMDAEQMVRMIAAEAGTYALAGCVVGCAVGLPLHRYLYRLLVTNYWGDAWSVPVLPVAMILSVVALSVVAAVYAPAKRIRGMAITETINEL